MTVLDILARMDREILVVSTFQRRDVLGVLGVCLQRFGESVPFDESLYRYVTGMELCDCSLETAEDGLRGLGCVESGKRLLLDVRDECRSSTAAGLRYP